MTTQALLKVQDPVLDLLLEKKLLQIIVAAFSETVSGYTKVAVTAEAPVVLDHVEKSDIAVGGALRLEAANLSFELFLGLPQELFCLLYERVFDVETAVVSDQNHDFAGELLNIAFGSIDPKFREKGYRFCSSLPLVFSGPALEQVLARLGGRVILLPYLAEGKKFQVQVYSAGRLGMTWQYDGHAGPAI